MAGGPSQVIIAQGVFGTIPSAAQSFTTMYLQLGQRFAALSEVLQDAQGGSVSPGFN